MMTTEIECHDCDGWGFIPPVKRMGETLDCEHCNGTGWREETDEEAADRSADAYSDMCEGEPPLSMQEQYEAAWRQKQELRR